MAHKPSEESAHEFEKFYEESFSALTRYVASYVGDHHIAEDIAINVLTKCWQDWGKIPEMARRSWVFTVAYRDAMSHFRAKGGRKDIELEEDHVVVDAEPNIDGQGGEQLFHNLLPKRLGSLLQELIDNGCDREIAQNSSELSDHEFRRDLSDLRAKLVAQEYTIRCSRCVGFLFEVLGYAQHDKAANTLCDVVFGMAAVSTEHLTLVTHLIGAIYYFFKRNDLDMTIYASTRAGMLLDEFFNSEGWYAESAFIRDMVGDVVRKTHSLFARRGLVFLVNVWKREPKFLNGISEGKKLIARLASEVIQ
jgi:DNA-directed RNA polymerase specialized sigma24 family protein